MCLLSTGKSAYIPSRPLRIASDLADREFMLIRCVCSDSRLRSLSESDLDAVELMLTVRGLCGMLLIASCDSTISSVLVFI